MTKQLQYTTFIPRDYDIFGDSAKIFATAL